MELIGFLMEENGKANGKTTYKTDLDLTSSRAAKP